MTNLQSSTPITIASRGTIPTVSTSSSTLNLSSQISTLSTSTNMTSTTSSGSSLSGIDCADDTPRKQRSLVDLSELNKQYGNGYQPPPPSQETPPTVYENLAILEASKAPSFIAGSCSPMCSISSTDSNLGKLLRSSDDDSDDGVDVLIKVKDCFD
ncbi:hypothetical protein CRE_01689 [Caenorhabditis remanei]|uniref:Uncharacterized protein n=1 Tax=Caenorhabditis remanei TaxID=31234 RepID=E3LH71_CAERE|nr:hypothetical protein CRE_01689 [Caenorhabditis remanei]